MSYDHDNKMILLKPIFSFMNKWNFNARHHIQWYYVNSSIMKFRGFWVFTITINDRKEIWVYPYASNDIKKLKCSSTEIKAKFAWFSVKNYRKGNKCSDAVL